jgi:hypothetical protein
MDSHCHDDVIQFLRIFLRIFLVARYRAVGIVTRVTCAPQSKCYKKSQFNSEYAKNGFVSNSVTEEIFLDLNLLRDQVARKINTRSTLQATRFAVTSACSRHTKNYFIRNLSTPLLEFDIKEHAHEQEPS